METLNEQTLYYVGFNRWLTRKRYEFLSQYFVGETCLEFGVGDGTSTLTLKEYFDRVVAVDGSYKALRIVEDIKNVEAIYSMFEDYKTDEKFDTVLLCHVLEHVDDPVELLKHAYSFVAPGGILIVDVPNGDSLHRQLGVHMDLLKERTELNSADLSIGHQRVYTPMTFGLDIASAGLSCEKVGGMFVKILANDQMFSIFDFSQLDGLFQLGVDNPDIAAEIYAVIR